MSLLGIDGLEPKEIRTYLELAQRFVDDDAASARKWQRSILEGRTVALLFFEPSTRTRISFELAAKRLGADVVSLTAQGSSVRKGESIVDTCQNLEAMGVDAFVIRHSETSVPVDVARNVDAAVFNAGNGTGEHPTQALIDAFSLTRHLGTVDLGGATIAMIGDIAHSRVARSDALIFAALGAHVVFSGPSYLMPEAPLPGATRVDSRADALRDADAVIMLRIQRERMKGDVDEARYAKTWGLDAKVLREELKPGAVVMHPGPVMYGVEVSEDVARGDRSLILKQAGFGVAVRQGVLGFSLAEKGLLL